MKLREFFTLSMVLILAVGTGWAQIQYQTRSTTKVGPGVTHRHIVAEEKFWNLNVLEIDLTNAYLRMETVKALDACIGRETTTSMAARRSYDGRQVIGAVNGDFFNPDGLPINVQVTGGQILRNPIGYSSIGFDAANHPILNIVHFSGQIITSSGGLKIDGVNKARESDQSILYNSMYGKSTLTNAYGVEVLLTPLTEWQVNGTVRCRVEKKENNKGNMTIGAGQIALSAHGSAVQAYQDYIHPGDEVQIKLELTPSLPGLKEMISGWCKIIDDGKNYVQQGYLNESGPPSAYAVHPRSAVGFSADSSWLYLVTVDGRRSGVYEGMTLPELADFMIGIGVAYGLNLDGGGSTTMVVRGGIKNHPSDANGERAVANALLAVSTAPKGSLGAIQIEPDNLSLNPRATVHFKTSAWDEYYNQVASDSGAVHYTAHPSLGTISDDGVFIAATDSAAGFIYAGYGNLKDSAYVCISPAPGIIRDAVVIRPENSRLFYNYPNPFNASTTIEFAVSRSGHVRLNVYDFLGRNVERLIDSELTTGPRRIVWNPQQLASGIYICSLTTLHETVYRKMIVLK